MVFFSKKSSFVAKENSRCCKKSHWGDGSGQLSVVSCQLSVISYRRTRRKLYQKGNQEELSGKMKHWGCWSSSSRHVTKSQSVTKLRGPPALLHGVNHDCDSPSRLTSSRSFLLLIQFPEWLTVDAVGRPGKVNLLGKEGNRGICRLSWCVAVGSPPAVTAVVGW